MYALRFFLKTVILNELIVEKTINIPHSMKRLLQEKFEDSAYFHFTV